MRRCKVNLIVYNEYPGTPFRPSTPERVQAFRSVLIQVCTSACSFPIDPLHRLIGCGTAWSVVKGRQAL